jgi:hypothetical protein
LDIVRENKRQFWPDCQRKRDFSRREAVEETIASCDMTVWGGRNMTNAKSGHLLVAVVAVLLAAILGVLVMLLLKEEPESRAVEQEGFKVGYAAEGVTIIDDQNAFNQAVEDAYATRDDRVRLRYQNEASSRDGRTFSCYLGNADSNAYDMFVAIYADSSFTDELFLSQLIRPGEAFQTITLNRALEAGNHTVYVVCSQVEVEDGQQKIHGQAVITLNFHVSE